MLVIIMENQLLPTYKVCQACLMADQSGQPRWQPGKLRCGRALTQPIDSQPEQYECQMGFRVANID
ncbi:MAG: hypothetical protein KME15_02820 [Drouetiella hepatica Uher 2000/2452]|jgi:hypothetical protein|uniref:Uncharacterized protein n=1 Tax=Drouetiella hepatica Uher 2000/2452 TaxID=904376 RepID=A0A951Q6M8_9CYAN|nr:hypothetical protein [Drouetiella hepatica Uher 2000/2452]